MPGPAILTLLVDYALVLWVLAALFALMNGANDGGTIVAMALRLPGLRPLSALGYLAASVLTVPLLIGTQVAQTLANRLVDFNAAGGRIAVGAAIASASLVIFVLSRYGLPTSLTLSLIGGITGAGLGAGLEVSWMVVVLVLFMAAAAPAIGVLAALGLFRLFRLVAIGSSIVESVSRMHRVSFGFQCLAYGLNDGQKMLAVFIVAAGLGAADRPPVLLMALIAVLFVVGSLFGLRRMSSTIGSGILAPRPVETLSAEAASAITVLATGAAGAPVSMTQSVAGGLLGSGISTHYRRVRWQAASRIGLAWVFTLPAAMLLSFLATFVLTLPGGSR